MLQSTVEATASALAAFDTATLHEAAGQAGAMTRELVSLVPGRRVAGPALTAACPRGDNLMLHAAVAQAQPGDVLVAQCHDGSYGVWGEVLTEAALARGVVALVVDGSVRDMDGIRALGFPVFARGTALQGATKKQLGTLQAPVSCGGVLVRPGDYVVADDSGIVSIAADLVEAVIASAAARREKEARLIEELRRGRTTIELLDLGPVLEALERGSDDG
jgi:4-hydroxy-4-methyl-2-oxoglutarate aldolase